MANENNNQNTVVSSQNSEETKKEVRTFAFEEMECRVDDSDKTMLTGYAAKFNSFTDLGWFKERIKSSAFDDVLDNDVRCLKNHDPNLIIGRTKNKTLRLKTNSVGLQFENDMPDTQTGRDVLEEVRSGLLSGCSFAFTVAEDDWKYFDDDRPAERTIVKIGQLFDVGPVTYPAYPDTTVAARSLEAVKAEKTATESTEDTEQKSNQSEKSDRSDESSDQDEKKDELTFEQKFEIGKAKRKFERLQNRLNQADACQ